jgi:hypothetical protein
MYQVGDEVILKVKITRVDPSDENRYRIENGFWFRENHVVGLASKLDVTPKRPARPVVGEYVTSARYSELGVGKIIRDDHDLTPFKVEWNSEIHFCTESDVTVVEKPAERFKVGDYVTSKLYAEEGVGRIEVDDHSGLPFKVRFKDDYEWCRENDLTLAEKPEEPKPLRLTVGDYVTHNRHAEKGVGKIVRDDHDLVPYRVRWPDGNLWWCSASNVTRAEKPKTERLKVGEFVTSAEYPKAGVGKIIKDDHSSMPFKVEFKSEWHWCSETDLTKTTKPEPESAFKEGDKVIHRHMPHWGVGTVIGVRKSDFLTDYREYSSPNVDGRQPRSADGFIFDVRYPAKNSENNEGIWCSVKEILVKAIV